MEQQLTNVIQLGATCTASSDGDSGCALDEYTWVPPGLTAQQVNTDICLHSFVIRMLSLPVL